MTGGDDDHAPIRSDLERLPPGERVWAARILLWSGVLGIATRRLAFAIVALVLAARLIAGG
jgi:hypothetical protein